MIECDLLVTPHPFTLVIGLHRCSNTSCMDCVWVLTESESKNMPLPLTEPLTLRPLRLERRLSRCAAKPIKQAHQLQSLERTPVSRWANVYKQTLATLTTQLSAEMLLIELSPIPPVVWHKFDLSARHPGLRKRRGVELMQPAYSCRLYVLTCMGVIYASASPEQYA